MVTHFSEHPVPDPRHFTATATPSCRCTPPCSFTVRVHDEPGAVFGSPYFAVCQAVVREGKGDEVEIVALVVRGHDSLRDVAGVHRAVCDCCRGLGFRKLWYERYADGQPVTVREVDLSK